MNAFFSGTDNNNDKDLIQYSGVLGKFNVANLAASNVESVWRFNYYSAKKEVKLQDLFEAPQVPEVEVPEEWIEQVAQPTPVHHYPGAYNGGYNGTFHGGANTAPAGTYVGAYNYETYVGGVKGRKIGDKFYSYKDITEMHQDDYDEICSLAKLEYHAGLRNGGTRNQGNVVTSGQAGRKRDMSHLAPYQFKKKNELLVLPETKQSGTQQQGMTTPLSQRWADQNAARKEENEAEIGEPDTVNSVHAISNPDDDSFVGMGSLLDFSDGYGDFSDEVLGGNHSVLNSRSGVEDPVLTRTTRNVRGPVAQFSNEEAVNAIAKASGQLVNIPGHHWVLDHDKKIYVSVPVTASAPKGTTRVEPTVIQNQSSKEADQTHLGKLQEEFPNLFALSVSEENQSTPLLSVVRQGSSLQSSHTKRGSTGNQMQSGDLYSQAEQQRLQNQLSLEEELNQQAEEHLAGIASQDQDYSMTTNPLELLFTEDSMANDITGGRFSEVAINHGTKVARAWFVIDQAMSELDGKDEMLAELMSDMFELNSDVGQGDVIRALYNRLSPREQARIQVEGL